MAFAFVLCCLFLADYFTVTQRTTRSCISSHPISQRISGCGFSRTAPTTFFYTVMKMRSTEVEIIFFEVTCSIVWFFQETMPTICCTTYFLHYQPNTTEKCIKSFSKTLGTGASNTPCIFKSELRDISMSKLKARASNRSQWDLSPAHESPQHIQYPQHFSASTSHLSKLRMLFFRPLFQP